MLAVRRTIATTEEELPSKVDSVNNYNFYFSCPLQQPRQGRIAMTFERSDNTPCTILIVREYGGIAFSVEAL
jgi:hypothetical protein